jgi:hypothetical protein
VPRFTSVEVCAGPVGSGPYCGRVNEWGFAGEIKSWWDTAIEDDPSMGRAIVNTCGSRSLCGLLGGRFVGLMGEVTEHEVARWPGRDFDLLPPVVTPGGLFGGAAGTSWGPLCAAAWACRQCWRLQHQ